MEIADTAACLKSFSSYVDYAPGDNSEFFGLALEKLPGGNLLGIGSYDNSAQIFTEFTPDGDLVDHWRLVGASSFVGTTDAHISTDNHVLFTRAPVSSMGGVWNNSFVAKLDYNTHQPVWYHNLTHLSRNIFAWHITENPLTQHYQVFGRMTNPGSNQGLTDDAIVLDLDPANGNILAQKNYPITEVPLVRSSVWVNNELYAVGATSYSVLTNQKAAMVKFDAFGQVLWSRDYSFTGPGLFNQTVSDWSDIRYDNGSLVVVGATGTQVFFIKTDMNGEPLIARVWSGGTVLGHIEEADAFNVDVLPDGYLISYTQGSGAGDGRLVLLKLDKNANIIWKKSRTEPGMDEPEVVVQGNHVYAFCGQGWSGDNFYFIRSPLLPPVSSDCARETFNLSIILPQWTSIVYHPQELPSLPVGVLPVTVNSSILQTPFWGFCFSEVCSENCHNEVDDDGDGLVDCTDVLDCPCLETTPDCSQMVNLPPQNPIKGVVEWQSVQSNAVFASCVPIVANLNPQQDDIPEVVVYTHQPDQNTPTNLVIYSGDGSNAANPALVTMPQGGYDTADGIRIAVGDLDGNGIPEVVVPFLDQKLYVFTNYNPQNNPALSLLASDDQLVDYRIKPFIADLDGNGKAEIILGHQVYWLDESVPNAPVLRNLLPNPMPLPSTLFKHAFAADLLSVADCNGDPDCEGQEIVVGNIMYSVDLDDTAVDGDPRSLKIQRSMFPLPSSSFFSGSSSVADVDLDGIQDVVTRAIDFAPNPAYLYVWNANGLVKEIHYPLFGSFDGGICAIANVFDDRKAGASTDLPEILFSSTGGKILAVNLNAAAMTPATPFWWEMTVSNPTLFFNSESTFDFNGDGLAEIVYRDAQSLRVLYGGSAPFPTGVAPDRTWFALPMRSQNYDAFPTIADVDNDGHAEILSVGYEGNLPIHNIVSGRLKVVGGDLSQGSVWMPARKVWNQHVYTPTAIEDDLRVPKIPLKGNVEMPDGSGNYPFNIVQGQKGEQTAYHGFELLPDASIFFEEAKCNGDSLEVKLRICNEGSGILTAGMPIRFYNGNPTLGPTASLAANPVLDVPLGTGACAEVFAVIPRILGQKIFVVANDDGSDPAPFQIPNDFPITNLEECNYTNNLSFFELPLLPAKPDLGPDVAVCQNGVWVFHAGPDFQSYRWSTLSTDSVITIYQPGVYWVETTDFCGNLYRDSVVVTVDPTSVIELGPDQKICSDSTLQLQAPGGFLDYSWFPDTDLSCSDCPAPTVQLAQSRTYSVQVSSALGCISYDTIHIDVVLAVATQSEIALCSGDSTLVFGSYVHDAGLYSQSFQAFNGCDSTHSIQVNVLPVFQTNETRQLCAGDSALVFGQFVHNAGLYSQNFQAFNGCDSTHSIQVNVLPVFQTNETRQICAGDSTLVFGQFVHDAGLYSQNFQAFNGCDSTHSIQINVLPVFQTNETRQICAGDSALVFGQYMYDAGSYSQNFQAFNGCDSTHSIQITVLPVFQTNETRQICAGDSALVFGQYVYDTGLYSQNFQAFNGCDSTHSIQVNVLPVFQTNETRQICAGDSALVFGQYVYDTGLFSQNFQAFNGCDSTHSIQVNVLPVFQSNETRQICAGDSALVFGQYVYDTGLFSQTFQAFNGCDSTHSIQLNVLPVFQSNETRQICAGDSALVFGQYVYDTGLFSQTFQAINGCDSTHSIQINVLPVFQSNETRQICAGDSALVFGQYVYDTGLYSQNFQAFNGCDSTHSIQVNVLPLFQTSETRQLCAGDSALVFGQYVYDTGLYSQTFQAFNGCDSTHSIQVNELSVLQTNEALQICTGDSTLVFGQYVNDTGLYSQTFQAAGGCDSIHTVQVNVLPVFQTNETRQICTGDSAWVFGQYVQNAGLYSQSFQATSGCDSIHSIELNVSSSFQTFETRQICTGDSLLIFGQFEQAAGTYHHTYQAVGGCDSVASIQLMVYSLSDLDIRFQPNCDGTDTVRISLAGGNPIDTSLMSFSLDGAPFNPATQYTGLSSGTHTLFSQDSSGCISSQDFLLPEPEIVQVSLPADTTINLGQSIEIQAFTQGAGLQYAWSPGLGLNCTTCPTVLAQPEDSIRYTVTVTDPFGCSASDQILIQIQVMDHLYVPSIFHPGGTGPNQYFTVYGNSNLLEIKRLDIYDRWGELVFRREHFAPGVPALGWDGSWRNRALPPGVYVYVVELEFKGQVFVEKTGDVTLIR